MANARSSYYWNRCREKLKKIFSSKWIETCEICGQNWILSFHHRHKRRCYYSQPELLGDFNQVLLLCDSHHDLLEKSPTLTKEWFLKLRGDNDEVKY
jgi:hypothetical protein